MDKSTSGTGGLLGRLNLINDLCDEYTEATACELTEKAIKRRFPQAQVTPQDVGTTLRVTRYLSGGDVDIAGEVQRGEQRANEMVQALFGEKGVTAAAQPQPEQES
ncbi:hypothetical protein [Pantoea sp. At-9b]|uniref:hypothetical protein n=1 Tax=Pantoea sp. (strain At-9b) TaxID=592316 RepID=UPI0001B404BA|nr:hypothetical protein [Pantoea sp. At-9b]ADU72792.1 hypothetical protein Pat9b_4228 [Pantoea sp. At-9b]